MEGSVPNGAQRRRKRHPLFGAESVRCSAGSQRKTSEGGGEHPGRPGKTERPAGYQDPAERSGRREDAESQVRFEPRNTSEEHPCSNVERREIPVRLAGRPVREYWSKRVADESTTS